MGSGASVITRKNTYPVVLDHSGTIFRL